MSINRVTITGNLTRDPELHARQTTDVLKIPVAVNDRRKDRDTGEWVDVPNYVDVIVFGKRAGALARLLSKGSKVAIEGKLRWHSWETANGEKRSKLDVIADDVELMQARQPEHAPKRDYDSEARQMNPEVHDGRYDDEEIPF